MRMFDCETLVQIKKEEIERKANNTMLNHFGLSLINIQREKSNAVQHVIKTMTNLY